MTSLMEDVLQLARYQSGRVEFKPALDDLDKLCKEIIEEYESQAQFMGRISYKSSAAPLLMSFDKHLMRQVISNLVSNALKYSPIEKIVRVNLWNTATDVELTVIDEGIGIPAEDMKHLFEPFHRARNVGTISGTGLGLSITWQAILMHSGTITPVSEIGKGTSITVIFPKK
jgi:signal transduction histidine kinase